jgi:hypothetical protein
VGEKSGLLSILGGYSSSDGVEWCENSPFYERGSSMGKEAVLADLGWAGEVAAGAVRLGRANFSASYERG